ncbi:hypothetical protein M758_3G030200, partial [Ceratodon purpureus]
MQRKISPMVVLALLIVVGVCSPLSSCTARSSPELEVGEEEARGFRRLLAAEAPKPAPRVATLFSKAAIDPNRDCANRYPKLNYKPVTRVCKPKVPATKACCAAFNKFACQYRSQVNNFKSTCPILFMAYLNYAGGYQDGYFIGKYIDGWK